jgi:hypothetical protein
MLSKNPFKSRAVERTKAQNPAAKPAAVNKLAGFMLLTISLWFVGGCTTLPSSKTSFPEPKEAAVEEVRMDARELLEKAVKTTNESKETQNFWFTGYIKNSIQNRTTTSMFDGVAMRPQEAFIVNGRIAAAPYQYYHYGDSQFIKKDGIWYPAQSTDAPPFDPFGGFTDWLPLLEDAKALKDQSVLSHLSHVIEVRISAKEWMEQSASPLFAEYRTALEAAEEGEAADALETLNHLLDNAVVKMTLWIGKEDHVIYQYSTWIVMPLPGAGYFDQETFFRFYRYDDPRISDHIQSPENVERWVNESEVRIKSGELEGELLK